MCLSKLVHSDITPNATLELSPSHVVNTQDPSSSPWPRLLLAVYRSYFMPEPIPPGTLVNFFTALLKFFFPTHTANCPFCFYYSLVFGYFTLVPCQALLSHLYIKYFRSSLLVSEV